MLAPLATYFLQKYLGWLVEGLDSQNFELSLWSGEVILRNLKVKVGALDLLGLPIAVKSGSLSYVRLKIPWRALGSDQVVVEIKGLTVVAVPKNEIDKFDPEAERSAALAAKQAAIDALEDDDASNAPNGDPLDSDSTQAEAPGIVASYITSIVDNCRVVISDTHIRLEDSSSSESPFATGLEMKMLSLESVDGQWKVITDMSERRRDQGLIRKSLGIRDLSWYLDPMQLDPDLSRSTSHDNTTNKEYILPPCSINVRLNFDDSIVGGTGPPRNLRATTPKFNVNVQLPTIGLRLLKIQYQNLINFAAFSSTYSLRFENRQHRPKASVLQDPAAWWRYAIHSIRDSVRKELEKKSWSSLYVALKHRKKYIALYMLRDEDYAYSKGQKPLNSKNKEKQDELKALETKLTVEQVKAFRKHAVEKLTEYRANTLSSNFAENGGGMLDLLMSPVKSVEKLFSGNSYEEPNTGAGAKSEPTSLSGVRSQSFTIRDTVPEPVDRVSFKLSISIGQFSMCLDNNDSSSINMPSSELNLERITANVSQQKSGMCAELSVGNIQVGYINPEVLMNVPQIIVGTGEFKHPSIPFENNETKTNQSRSISQSDHSHVQRPVFDVAYNTMVTRQSLSSHHVHEEASEAALGCSNESANDEFFCAFPVIANVDVYLKRLHLVWSSPFFKSLTHFFTLESDTEKERDQKDAIVFAAAAEARRLRNIGEARAKDAMKSSSRIIVNGSIEMPELVFATTLPTTIRSEHMQPQYNWLVIQLGHLKINSNEHLPQIFDDVENISFNLSKVHGESKQYPSKKVLATYEKFDITLEDIQIVYFDVEKKQTGSVINLLSIEVGFERCLAQSTLEVPGLRLNVRVPNTSLNVGHDTVKIVTKVLEMTTNGIDDEIEQEEVASISINSGTPDMFHRHGSYELPDDVLKDLQQASIELGGPQISSRNAKVKFDDRLWLQKSVGMQIVLMMCELTVNLIDDSSYCDSSQYSSGSDDNHIIATLKMKSFDLRLLQRTYDTSMLLELGHLSLSDCTNRHNSKNHFSTIPRNDGELLHEYFFTTDNCVRREMPCKIGTNKAGKDVSCKLTQYQIKHTEEPYLKLRLAIINSESPSYGDREECPGSPSICAKFGILSFFIDGKRIKFLMNCAANLFPEEASMDASESKNKSTPTESEANLSTKGANAKSSVSDDPPLLLDMEVDGIALYISGSPNSLHCLDLKYAIQSSVKVIEINVNLEKAANKLTCQYTIGDIQIHDEIMSESSSYSAVISKDRIDGIPNRMSQGDIWNPQQLMVAIM